MIMVYAQVPAHYSILCNKLLIQFIGYLVIINRLLNTYLTDDKSEHETCANEYLLSQCCTFVQAKPDCVPGLNTPSSERGRQICTATDILVGRAKNKKQCKL